MEGRAYGVWWAFVERQRRRIVELEDEVRRRDQGYAEAWFEVTAMGQDGALESDKGEAGARLKTARDELESAQQALAEARRKLPLYEKTLNQYTQQ